MFTNIGKMVNGTEITYVHLHEFPLRVVQLLSEEWAEMYDPFFSAE